MGIFAFKQFFLQSDFISSTIGSQSPSPHPWFFSTSKTPNVHIVQGIFQAAVAHLVWVLGRLDGIVNWLQGQQTCPEKLKGLRKIISQDLITLHLLFYTKGDFTTLNTRNGREDIEGLRSTKDSDSALSEYDES